MSFFGISEETFFQLYVISDTSKAFTFLKIPANEALTEAKYFKNFSYKGCHITVI